MPQKAWAVLSGRNDHSGEVSVVRIRKNAAEWSPTESRLEKAARFTRDACEPDEPRNRYDAIASAGIGTRISTL